MMGTLIYFSNNPSEEQYKLEEIEEGIYANYYEVLSRAPSYNTQVISFCANGQILTINGKVSILYTNETPKAIVKRSKLARGSEVIIKVPKNSIKFLQNVAVN